MKDMKAKYHELIRKYEKRITVSNILVLYRYLSFVVTLLFYYITAPQKDIAHRLVIIAGMVLAYITLTLLYFNNRSNKTRIFILGIVETIENSIFIVISGGFASPFLWFYISSVFIAAVELSHLTAVIFAGVYFVSAIVSTLYVFAPNHNYDLIRLYLNTAISYIMVVEGILQLIRYAVKVEDKTDILSTINMELKEAKLKVEKTLKYCIEIYETVNIFNLHKNDNILQELTSHMKYLTGVEQILFIRLTPNEKRGSYTAFGLKEEEEEKIVLYTMDLLERESEEHTSGYYRFDDKILSIHFVMYDDDPCGVFVLVSNVKWNIYKYEQGERQFINTKEEIFDQNRVMPIFMKIAGIIVKRLEIDEMEEQLLISEEQNRIANEIHDIALQKLFAISCKLYVLSAANQNMELQNLKKELFDVKQSIDITMKELREAIYGFSWDKQGVDTFRIKLEKYTEDIRTLHGVEAYTVIEGDTQKITANRKNGLYRVICEAMNNAVRHGKARHINVKIVIDNSCADIRITDDGTGFDYNDYMHKDDKGLGLSNIYRIVDLLNGHVEINTQIMGGTEIIMSIPCRSAA